MSDSHPKSTDGLMRYLRDKKGISISGSSQKRKLMNIGYYPVSYTHLTLPTKLEV